MSYEDIPEEWRPAYSILEKHYGLRQSWKTNHALHLAVCIEMVKTEGDLVLRELDRINKEEDKKESEIFDSYIYDIDQREILIRNVFESNLSDPDKLGLLRALGQTKEEVVSNYKNDVKKSLAKKVGRPFKPKFKARHEWINYLKDELGTYSMAIRYAKRHPLVDFVKDEESFRKDNERYRRNRKNTPK